MKQARQRGKHLMARIDDRTREALAWLRFILNPETAMPVVTDWAAVLSFADKQSLVGICMPFQCADRLEKEQRMQWYGLCQRIEYQNKLLNQRIGQLFGMLEEAGFACCLLKGQGNAALYPNPLLRCAGDIDVWVDAGEEAVARYVKKKFPEEKETYKHIHFPVFDDVSVDIHATPLKLYHPVFGKRLQRWIDRQKDEQFRHRISFTGLDREVSVPTCRFNSVYLLGHMLIHLFDEGVGLRHVIDYFYLLKKLDAPDVQKEQIRKDFSDLGMMRFAKAVMWIERSVLGLPEEYCLVESDERGGRKLLADMLEGGNFGQFSTRYQGRRGFYRLGMIKAKRTIDLFSIFPSEAVSRAGHRIHAALIHTFGKRPEQH